MLRSIWNYEGHPATIAALKILAYSFLRSAELRKAKWEDIDFDTREWIIPEQRMTKRKKRNPHFVPLTNQMIEVFTELQQITGGKDADLVFPGNRKDRPLSGNTFAVALANLGFTGDQHTPHGFRKTASSQLHALGYPGHLIRMQSGRCDSSVEGIYNLYEYKPERIEMMQQYSDHLDQLRKGASLTAIKSKIAL